MEIERVEISDDVAEKIQRKHNVSVDEVYEVLGSEDEPPIVKRSEVVPGAYVAYGRTGAGRYVIVPYLPVERTAVVLTARSMTATGRRWYQKQRRR